MHVATKRALHSVARTSRTSPLLFRNPAIYRPPRSGYVCYRCSYLHLSAKLQNSQIPPSSDHTGSITTTSSTAAVAGAPSQQSSLSTPKETGSDIQSSSSTSSPSPEESSADDGQVSAESEVPLPPEIVSALRAATGGDGTDPEQPDKRPAARGASTRTRGTKKSAKPKEESLPKIDLPEWFLERAVFLPEELEARESRLDVMDRFGTEISLEEEGTGEESGGGSGVGSGGGPSKEIDVENEPSKITNVKGEDAPDKGLQPLTEEDTAEIENTNEDSDVEADPKATSGSSEPEPVAPMIPPTDPEPESKIPLEPTGQTDAPIDAELRTPEIAFFTPSVSIDTKYGLSPAVWGEVWSTVKGTLSLPKPIFNQAKVARTVDCVLLFPQTPDTNGTYFLDAVSEDLARQLGATLVRIDAEDVAEIAGDYVETSVINGKPAASAPISMPTGELRTLGYDAQFIHPNNRPRTEEEEEEEEGVSEGEGEENETGEDGENSAADFDESNRPFRSDGAPSFFNAGVLPTIFQRLFVSSRSSDVDGVIDLRPPGPGQGVIPIQMGMMGGPPPPQSDAHPKLQAVLELMLDSGIKKREVVDKAPGKVATVGGDVVPINRTIIQVRDYKELQGVSEGRTFLKILRKLVYQRRSEGREIMILGNSATVGHGMDLNSAFLTALQTGVTSSSGIMERTIVVPPQPWDTTRELLERDRKARIREINMRHLKAMITRRSGEDGHAVVLEVPKDWHFDNTPKVSNISEWVWDLDSIHRLTLAILGTIPSPGATEVGPRVIGPNDVAEGIKVIKKSDKAKLAWSTAEVKFAEEREAAEEEEPTADEVRAAKLRKLKGKCNKHEKRLLAGVIDPTSISTGFDRVRAAEDTVDALKTLTSLSLLRPDAFCYGVLSQDKIPGVLLYGPPGTGKTLLAKAVAKESGATVLEVSGSEIYDMYVGEGEKNVKAIFSLAKKLSPCVVFIDEADAIFGARTAHHQRTSHRELINQFLKEWDGMAKMSAFIMVATNRPFDLDDAVLRRLPRRILIDLPTAADRLAIMNIHLNGEDLDADVDLSTIASDERTNLYSGSDLKNVAVAAALAAVREENIAFQETGLYPAKRILKKKHFEQALGEITASISDDMGSLGMIRKFDEKYGDRRGRKKKNARWGFGGAVGPGENVKETGTGRVRN
ncbi:hypothetical protein ABW20_dc0103387 [Dactylellina cionopaga]|nr:hypothetical protein ABW20_dc0103387 [Dactylellina cionopaga]